MQSVVNLFNIVDLGLELVVHYSIVHLLQVLLGDSWAYRRSILDELCQRHFVKLIGVVGITVQHDQCVAEDMDFPCLPKLVRMRFKVHLRKYPHNPFNLLCFARNLEL